MLKNDFLQEESLTIVALLCGNFHWGKPYRKQISRNKEVEITMDDLDPSVTSDGSVHSDVKDYYGKVLAATSDLKSTACCTRINKSGLSERLRDALAKIHPEVNNK